MSKTHSLLEYLKEIKFKIAKFVFTFKRLRFSLLQSKKAFLKNCLQMQKRELYDNILICESLRVAKIF